MYFVAKMRQVMNTTPFLFINSAAKNSTQVWKVLEPGALFSSKTEEIKVQGVEETASTNERMGRPICRYGSRWWKTWLLVTPFLPSLKTHCSSPYRAV